MMRPWAKAIGLGLALFEGELHAADGVPSVLPPAQAAPALLPPSLAPQGTTWNSPTTDDTLWLPARPRAAKTTNTVPISPASAIDLTPTLKPTPDSVPVTPAIQATTPIQASPSAQAAPATPVSVDPAIGPRPSSPESILGPLPQIPVPEGSLSIKIDSQAGPLVQPQPQSGQPRDWRPVPESNPSPVNTLAYPVADALTPIDDPPAKTIPKPPMGDPLPPPRPLPLPAKSEKSEKPPARRSTSDTPPNSTGELPIAPPELMGAHGATVPGRSGTFGSAPVKISRDYPPLGELVLGSWWGHRDSSTGKDQTSGSSDGTPTDRFSFRAEYFLWSIGNQQIPALATTSVNGGFGYIGDPGTRTLLGPGPFGNALHSGMRLRAGYWFDDCGSIGVDGSFFFLGTNNKSVSFDSSVYPTITRPIFAPNFNSEFGEIVALPGFAQGNLKIDTNNTLYGFDTNLRTTLCRDCTFRAEAFVGYRFLEFDEGLRITENITSLQGNTSDPAGTRVVVQDQFKTQNSFNGGQIGLAAEKNWGRFSLDVRGSLALGDSHESVDISGFQSRLRPGMTTPDLFNGGLLATGPNLGNFSRDRFSVVPEMTINLGYWVTPALKFYVGYNFLYWSNVLRPGEQIDRVVDVSLVPNPPAGVAFSGVYRPQPTFKQSDLVVNGVQFGCEFRW